MRKGNDESSDLLILLKCEYKMPTIRGGKKNGEALLRILFMLFIASSGAENPGHRTISMHNPAKSTAETISFS